MKDCTKCLHYEDYYTCLTGCVLCQCPNKDESILLKSMIRMGKWVVPIKTGQTCNRFKGKERKGIRSGKQENV